MNGHSLTRLSPSVRAARLESARRAKQLNEAQARDLILELESHPARAGQTLISSVEWRRDTIHLELDLLIQLLKTQP